MSSDSTEEITGTYNPVQYGFFTAEGGQWVFRGETVEEVAGHISDLLTAIDETDGPALLSDIQALKAAGVLKEGKNPAQNASGGGSSAGASGIPQWVFTEGAKIAGRELTAADIKTGIAKSGRSQGQPWYKYGDTWINQPRG